jgi:hypothetical protein
VQFREPRGLPTLRNAHSAGAACPTDGHTDPDSVGLPRLSSTAANANANIGLPRLPDRDSTSAAAYTHANNGLPRVRYADHTAPTLPAL